MMDIVARRFNEKMRYHWQAILGLKLHYVLSQREERYWRTTPRRKIALMHLRKIAAMAAAAALAAKMHHELMSCSHP